MDRAFGRLLAGFNTFASVWILALVLLISSDVIGRNAFNHPIPGVPEIVRFSVVTMFWLQMAFVLRKGAHLRTTLGLNLLPPFAHRIVLTLNALIGVAMFSLIAWFAWSETVKTWAIGAFEGEHPVRIPIWPVWGILVGGAVLTAIQYALDACGYPHDTREGTDDS